MPTIAKSLLVGAILMCSSSQSMSAADPETISLWDGRAPVGDGSFTDEDPRMFVYRPEKPNGTAIVICPGGGYGGLAIEPEGHGIARWLNKHGITGVVVKYRLPRGRTKVPMMDAFRAIRMTRQNARLWKLNPDRIGIMGFSAGGHLASTCATQFESADAQRTDPLQRLSSRPDFAILIYPVITMGAQTHGGSRRNLLGADPGEELVRSMSSELRVTAVTCPTFLAHALDDKPVPPINSQMFYEALQRHRVPSRYLKLPNGGHGLNGYKGPSWEAWQKQSLEWLNELPDRPS